MAIRKKVVNKKDSDTKRKISRTVSTQKPKVHSGLKSKQRPKPRWLKLPVELVPESQWYKNLRKQVRPGVWGKLRKEIYAQAGYKCQVCGAEGKLHCHEKWEFDEKNLT